MWRQFFLEILTWKYFVLTKCALKTVLKKIENLKNSKNSKNSKKSKISCLKIWSQHNFVWIFGEIRLYLNYFFRSDLIETLHDELSNASDGLSTKRSWIQRPLQTNKSFFDALQVISYNMIIIYDRKYLNNVQIYA